MTSYIMALSLMAFFFWKASPLKMLLSLELTAISLLLLMALYFTWPSYLWLIVYFVFMVCEGALGLSLLVTLAKSQGRPTLHNTFLLW